MARELLISDVDLYLFIQKISCIITLSHMSTRVLPRVANSAA